MPAHTGLRAARSWPDGFGCPACPERDRPGREAPASPQLHGWRDHAPGRTSVTDGPGRTKRLTLARPALLVQSPTPDVIRVTPSVFRFQASNSTWHLTERPAPIQRSST